MAPSIESDEADRPARDLADATHESLAEAVPTASHERLDRVREEHRRLISEAVTGLSAEYTALPVVDERDPDAVLGHDWRGLPT
ncbi:type II toxin-antitoxin system VapB family antitoxin [Geodermatophilus sp. DSM 44513]|uniref:type II toxin-antitoxin system VapB family antitoxin n=1 Tax=Geodermatophilus sp. DSM 44513 TaxID=1528104 RepID=UPI001284B98E|nr:type II toxin-antitoxin system VapB family antitoxin [Geodermatophilus sp. DSM 44513]WNV74775.1 type II toxin-antitoxin system VapB family antitoxin [Geodermatophilus sp. DSM 44513]